MLIMTDFNLGEIVYFYWLKDNKIAKEYSEEKKIEEVIVNFAKAKIYIIDTRITDTSKDFLYSGEILDKYDNPNGCTIHTGRSLVNNVTRHYNDLQKIKIENIFGKEKENYKIILKRVYKYE